MLLGFKTEIKVKFHQRILFKKKGKQDSFTLDGSITVEHDQIKVPKSVDEAGTEVDLIEMSG